MKEATKGAAATAEAHGAPATASGGFNAWLPLIANIVLMPAIAYGVATFVILPRLNSAGAPADEKVAGEHGAKPASEKGDHKGAKEGKVTVPLGGKVLVNVSGTQGTRFLMVSISLVGTEPNFAEEIAKSDVQLRDAAASALATKTIADLEKPGARNLIRTELLGAFNTVMGNSSVTEILFPEFAIQ